MIATGRTFRLLDGWLESFSIGALVSFLKPQWIDEALEGTGREGQRKRKLTARFTVWLLVAMALFRNHSIQNVVSRLGVVLGKGAIWRGGKPPASSSTVKARDRLGVAPLLRLAERVREWILDAYGEAMTWRGLKVMALDGCTLKVPDSPQNRSRFGLPGANRGRAAFPQMRALILVSTRLHMILKALFAPYAQSEANLAMQMLRFIPEGTLVLLDRNFNMWLFLVGITRGGSHFLVRAKNNMTGCILKHLGKGDALVEMKVNRHVRKKDRKMPASVLVREISTLIGGKKYRFFTSLLDPKAYPAKELVRMYAERWEEELVLDDIKTHQIRATTVNRPVIFRCLLPRRVIQEAYALVITYNTVRALMADAARRTGSDPLRLSFTDSLERIRDATLLIAAAPISSHPSMVNDLIDTIAQCKLPPRRDRRNRRQVCVKMSAYPLKKKPVQASRAY